MEALDLKKAMAILIAMDPNKAADVLAGKQLLASPCALVCNMLKLLVAARHAPASPRPAHSELWQCGAVMSCHKEDD